MGKQLLRKPRAPKPLPPLPATPAPSGPGAASKLTEYYDSIDFLDDDIAYRSRDPTIRHSPTPSVVPSLVIISSHFMYNYYLLYIALCQPINLKK